jgi:hypothetical protein
MTTKDYVYLALVALSAIVFYLNGFQAGVARTRRLFEKWFISRNTFPELPPEEEPDLAVLAPDAMLLRRQSPLVATPTIRASFGRN